MLVAVGHIIDKYIIGEGNVFRTATIFFYCSDEEIRIIKKDGSKMLR